MQRLLRNERGIAAILVIIYVLAGVVVVGGVGAAVVLSNNISITVDNRGCGTLDIAEASAAANFNFLPGINVPSQIAQGDVVTVQVPKSFVDSVTVQSGSVEVRAFSRSFTLGTSSIDMQKSTLDGSPLADLVGQEVDLSIDHTLVIECNR